MTVLLTTDTQAHLEAALKRLSTCETLPNAIPYRDRIPQIAHQLTFMKRSDARPTAHPADQRPFVTLKSALSLLQRAAALAQDERVIDLDLPTALGLRLLFHAVEAGEIAREIELIAASAPRPPRARPKHTVAARNIAAYLYQETERLTGRKPVRSFDESGADQSSREKGEFVELVREVFKILGVKPSPEEAARYAIEEAKERRLVAALGPAPYGDKSKNRQT